MQKISVAPKWLALIQVTATVLLVCFYIFIFPEIEARAARQFDPRGVWIVGATFWPILGFVLSLPRWFEKTKSKINPYYLPLVLTAFVLTFELWAVLLFGTRLDLPFSLMWGSVEAIPILLLLTTYFLPYAFKEKAMAQ